MTVHRTAWITLACGLLASAGTAFAQDAGTGDEPAEPATGEPAPPPDGAPDAAAAPASRWPRSVIARPLTLPAGLAQVGADVASNKDLSVIGTQVVAGYGITDDLELTGFYAFALEEFEIKGSLDVDVGYKLARGAAGGKLEVIGRARAGYDVLGEIANPIRLGAHVQYNVTDKLALITPGQQLSAELEETTVGMASAREIFLQLPVAVGFQATPELYLQLDTTLAKIEIADSANAFFGADTTPIALTAVYNAMPALDVIGAFAINLSTPEDDGDPMTPEASVSDSIAFLIGARYYVGAL